MKETESDVYEIPYQELEKLFREYILRVPTSLAVRSTMRMMGLSKLIPAGSSVLDVGCGDGCFGLLYPREAHLTLDGIDLSADESRLAVASGAYRSIQVGDISKTVPEGVYDIALGNCSMEHVPDIHQALKNIYSVLRPGGKLLLSVPAFGWARTLAPVAWLERHSVRLAMSAAGSLDGFFQHHHLYGHQTWKMILQGNGFEVRSVQGLGGARINRIFAQGLPPAFIEFVFKLLLRHYPNLMGRFRRVPPAEALQEIWQQPIAVDSPHRIEYVLEAVRPA